MNNREESDGPLFSIITKFARPFAILQNTWNTQSDAVISNESNWLRKRWKRREYEKLPGFGTEDEEGGEERVARGESPRECIKWDGNWAKLGVSRCFRNGYSKLAFQAAPMPLLVAVAPVTRVRVRIITTYTFVHPGDNYCRPGLGV